MSSLNDDFVFRPLPAIAHPVQFPFPSANPLGPLADLPGDWGGHGFNVIWRPNDTPHQPRFLELNLTNESLKFQTISGKIPNRGLLQQDINMFGVTYLQQISDANVDAGLHIEPGVWAVVPETTDPPVPPTVVRMASIPHGTTILAQGSAVSRAGPPDIPDNDIRPFLDGEPSDRVNFAEQDLDTPTNFRSAPAQIVGIVQSAVDNPNSLLRSAIAGQTILSTITLEVATASPAPITGGGTANTAFLAGAGHGPNAVATSMMSTFWIELVQGAPDFLQLQYSQTVLLKFANMTWPHVSVGTLRKVVPVTVPLWKVDPDMPLSELAKVDSPIPLGGAHVRMLQSFGVQSMRSSGVPTKVKTSDQMQLPPTSEPEA